MISFVLDEESPRDCEELQGKIKIVGNPGLIEQEVAYIDSWLIALAQGVRGLQSSGAYSVEILEEPEPIYFLSQGEGFTLRFRNMTANIASLPEFLKELRVSARELLSRIAQTSAAGAANSVRSLREIVEFL
jgi:hypothetical protein